MLYRIYFIKNTNNKTVLDCHNYGTFVYEIDYKANE